MSEPLQFEHAEYEQGAPAPVCAHCQRPLVNSYFQLNDAIVCEACAVTAEQSAETGTGLSRALRATGGGLAAALLGGGLYFAVAAMTGYEFGLIAIVVGVAVGSAVRWGSYGRGGWRYQTLAMALTYLAIVGTYVPYIIRGMDEAQMESIEAAAAEASDDDDAAGATNSDATADAVATTQATATDGEGSEVVVQQASAGQILFAFAFLLAIACAAPFLAGFQNIIGLIIIGIGLYEAWKLNCHVPVVMTGPHPVTNTGAPAAV